MEVASPEWKRLIQDGAEEFGVHLGSEHTEQCARHAVELLRWANKINLTAITDPVEIAVKHYLDSLVPIPWLPKGDAALLDIGSGGGFPGIPLKICAPSVSMTLVDASRKKTSFLNHVIRVLGLKKAEAIQTRVEHLSYSGSFDIIVSRAVSNFTELCRMASPLLSPHGTIIGFLGKPDGTEKPIFDNDQYVLNIIPYVLPHLKLHRALAFIRMRKSNSKQESHPN